MSWTGLPEFKDDTLTDYNRPLPAIESTSDNAQNKNPFVTETEASPSTISPKPFIKFVKETVSSTEIKTTKVETAKPAVKYAAMYSKPLKSSEAIGTVAALGTCQATYPTSLIMSYLMEDIGRDFKLIDDTNVLLRTPRQHNMYSIDLNNIVPHKDLTFLVAKASADEGKQHKASCKSKLVNSVTKPLHTLHMDLFGATFDETSGILRKFIIEIENLKDLKVKIIRVLVNKSQNKTSYELFNGRTPAIGFIKPFSCHVMILNTLDNLGKFEGKGDEENKAIDKGAGLNWLFDIDSLTKSMNYVPVVVTVSLKKLAILMNLKAVETPILQLETLTVETPIPTVSSLVMVTPYTRRKGKEKMIESETPKKKKIQEQMDIQMARQMEEEMEREAQKMNKQIVRDAEIARIHAKEELQIIIDGLDRSNETVAKYLQEYHQFATELPIERRIKLISDLVRQRDFKGMTLEEIKENFDPVWKQIHDFIPIGLKEEAERFKRKGIRFKQESVKKLKTSEEVKAIKEVPKEKLKEMMQLVPIKERLVNEPLSIRSAGSDKEMELWVELKRLYKPDVEDQLWTHTQNLMHAPVEWKLYDTCGVHHVTSKDKDIFMLMEKDYPLKKGLAIEMISYKL
nr:hypothetical protein [Tanacetum cinerariifolium]